MLQETIPDLSTRRLCNAQEINILTGAEREAHQAVAVGKLTLPARAELTVRLAVSVGSRIGEGLVERAEIASGVYLANSLVTVNNGHFITSILSTREQGVELPNPVVKW